MVRLLYKAYSDSTIARDKIIDVQLYCIPDGVKVQYTDSAKLNVSEAVEYLEVAAEELRELRKEMDRG